MQIHMTTASRQNHRTTFFSETDFIDVNHSALCNKLHTNGRIRNLLKTHFVNIKHIKMRRTIDQFLSPEHSTK